MTNGAGRAVAILILAILTGCASQTMDTQAFKPGEFNLDEIENNLVFLPVHIRPDQANLKLSGVTLVDQATGKWLVYSFFDNFLLGSRGIPYETEGGKVLQNVLIDLPNGIYELKQVQFSFLHETASSGSLRHEFDDPLRLTVEDHTYAGRLHMEFEQINIKGLFGTRTITFPMTEDVTKYTLDGMSATIRVDSTDHQADDVYFLADEYPGIERVAFSARLLE